MSLTLHTKVLVAACIVLLAGFAFACGTTSGGVEHPPAGGTNTPDYCKTSDPQEDNCMACTSKPGCGYCSSPAAGAASCQPGSSDDNSPSSCGEALIIGSDQCEAPPPPLE